MNKRQKKELIMRSLFTTGGFTAIVILFLIIFFLFKEGIPIFNVVSIKNFLFGRKWYPTFDPPDFGIYPLIAGSITVSALATIIAVPLGVFSAVYISEIANYKIKEILKPIIELIAAMPSVVIGFFGMVVFAPLLQNIFDISTGLNMFNAGIMLSIMAVPTICSISEDALNSVPRELKEASLALGATKFETIYKVTIPAAFSGISTAIILGMARAIGETMVVLMVAGGAAVIPKNIFKAVRPMTANIAAEMGEAPVGSNHYHALFAIGIVLFFITMIFNLTADYISSKSKLQKYE
jgi:phosphate transport system permease protein